MIEGWVLLNGGNRLAGGSLCLGASAQCFHPPHFVSSRWRSFSSICSVPLASNAQHHQTWPKTGPGACMCVRWGVHLFPLPTCCRFIPFPLFSFLFAFLPPLLTTLNPVNNPSAHSHLPSLLLPLITKPGSDPRHPLIGIPPNVHSHIHSSVAPARLFFAMFQPDPEGTTTAAFLTVLLQHQSRNARPTRATMNNQSPLTPFLTRYNLMWRTPRFSFISSSFLPSSLFPSLDSPTPPYLWYPF